MNIVTLLGRLTRDPELRTTTNQTAVCSFTVAVDRKFKTADGERQADFINCVAWKGTAEFVQKYFQKGHKIALIGSIQTRSYEKDGVKHSITEVIVDEVEFVEKAAPKDEFEL